MKKTELEMGISSKYQIKQQLHLTPEPQEPPVHRNTLADPNS